jgi:hypothetical protein
MTVYLRQSTASQEVPLGAFVDSTDGVTPETGLTINNTDIEIWKSGATSLVDKNSGGATHMAGGIYVATLDATDTSTLGPLVLFVYVSGALAVRLECMVLTSAAYDVLTAVTGDAFARLGAPAGASVSADVAAVKAETVTILADTNDIQTRIPAALVSGRIDASVGAMATDTLTASALAADAVTEIQAGLATSAALAALPAATDNADALLGRNVSGGSSTGRTVKQALHAMRNKQVVSAGTLTVYDTDDSTTSWTAAVTQTAGDPISAIDPT